MVCDVVCGTLDAVAQGPPGPVAELTHLRGALVEQPARVAEHRARPERVEAGLLAGEPAADQVTESVPGALDQAELLGDVGDDQLGCVGGG